MKIDRANLPPPSICRLLSHSKIYIIALLTMLASSLLMRRSAAFAAARPSLLLPTSSTLESAVTRRFKSNDAGDVIGIDLGTTNSCVAIMVRIVAMSTAVYANGEWIFVSRPMMHVCNLLSSFLSCHVMMIVALLLSPLYLC